MDIRDGCEILGKAEFLNPGGALAAISLKGRKKVELA
jgi:hypothetical protein